MAGVQDSAVRKRAQITQAGRTMFLWVVIASALVSFAVIASIFLGKRLLFNESVLAEKRNTINTLKANNEVVPDLESEILALNSNENLIKTKANADDEALQVILDALPSDANSLALGASLQQVLLANIDDLQLESLQVDSVQGVESLGDSSTVDASSSTSSGSGTIGFTFSVVGSDVALHELLERLEASIRTITVLSISIEGSNSDRQTMTVQAQAYYEPVKTVALQEKTLPEPKKTKSRSTKK